MQLAMNVKDLNMHNECIHYIRIYTLHCIYGGFLKWWYPQIIHFLVIFHGKQCIHGGILRLQGGTPLLSCFVAYSNPGQNG